MSPTFIILISFAAIALFFHCLTFFSKSIKKKKEDLFLHLSQEGTANELIFCSQEILQNKVIGIDGIHRKIMIVEKIKNTFNYSVISLDEVEYCELITNCGSLNADNLKKFETENLHAIELQFGFKNHTQPASIIFYDSLINSKKELILLKAKAEYWSVMLSKMLTGQAHVRARA
jgi:hypothetical protein